MANEQLVKIIEQAGDVALSKHIPLTAEFIAEHMMKMGVEIPVRCKDCVFSRKLNSKEKRKYADGVRMCTNIDVYLDDPVPVFNVHYCSYGKHKSGTQPQREGV